MNANQAIAFSHTDALRLQRQAKRQERSDVEAAFNAQLAAVREARAVRYSNPLHFNFNFDDAVMRAKAAQEAAYKAGSLRGLPSAFGAL